jgi:L-amino acid N-acyltransferase YncA
VRLADPERDAAAVAAIYRPAVEASIASFEESAPTPVGMAERMRATLRATPWLVAEEHEGGGIVGYAYASRHRERAGYRWSADISVYVADGLGGRGIGGTLYSELLDILRRQGYVNVYAGIALPNAASVALHERIGMRLVGIYERVGFKFGAWHDVAWYGMRLSEPDGRPPDPTPLPDLAP